jgi:pyridoxine 5-phosphate synthase
VIQNKKRLGVNIDHVATLRQQRGENYPSLVDAARVSLEAGADQITIHLREDRRHIQDTDVSAIKMVTQRYGKPLNLELGTNDDIIQIAIDAKPDWICIVPEKREERTTEGGLNLLNLEIFDKVAKACELFNSKIPQSKISLFVEANMEILGLCGKLPVNAVEIHTGDYAKAFLEENDITNYLKRYQDCEAIIRKQGIGYHAGHGLTDESLRPLVENNLFDEYNIGHWIVCDSVFNGLTHSIQKLTTIINKGVL